MYGEQGIADREKFPVASGLFDTCIRNSKKWLGGSMSYTGGTTIVGVPEAPDCEAARYSIRVALKLSSPGLASRAAYRNQQHRRSF